MGHGERGRGETKTTLFGRCPGHRCDEGGTGSVRDGREGLYERGRRNNGPRGLGNPEGIRS